MVKSVTSLGRSGLQDWMIQRVSAVVLAVYIIYLAVFMFSSPHLQYAVWLALFERTEFKIFSIIALAALCFHAWIGLWIISTDYLKPLAIRMVFQVLVIISCIALILWGAQILWSV